ncbi:head-tail connector protein [Porphyrobacter sp. ULC335]|uniref:head-tail connector protein n=1 Tax=Porphyrobacter sp. ULC335 TaxID=2854260 RepID=UPI002220A6F5|nr:hypothetical protein [Porphyrobacter sp. ULC335]UYV16108.1 hypothetical protein KVF90_01835 [Porphyrobacter sp. ULC335]
MQRIIVQPPVPGDAPLAELKHWLGISRPNEDEALGQLLDASLTICEAFTGKTPLRQTVEEIMPLASGWQELVSRPVREIVAAAVIANDGTRTAITALPDAIEWRISGSACVRLLRPVEGQGLALQLTVGIAPDWASLPAPLRHGIIRLAAHHFRDRDGKASAVPPASVTALWRPWRDVRLG